MHHHLKAIAAAALLLSWSLANATIYKCRSASGEVAFQEVPCPGKESGEEVKIRAQPTQADVAAAHARTHPEEYTGLLPNHEQPQIYRAQYAVEDRANSTPPATQRPSESSSSGYCPSGQTPLNASSYDPSRGWSSSKGYVPLRCGSANRQASEQKVRTGLGYTSPQNIVDQYGNGYIQASGSNFAIDTKTGKPCVVTGNTIENCN